MLSRNRSVVKAKTAREVVDDVRPRGQEKFSDSTFADVVRGAAILLVRRCAQGG